ncbi:hypothetical protein PG996_009368 [Apiospora saccharicola]|uniref:Uncharacterized protein n=1 Tax=Apiospora saccharicola TaxID=335842 RepID=A0ABR1UKL1_9PEZI
MWISLLLQAILSCELIGAVDGQFLSYMTSMVTKCVDILPTETPGTADPGGKPSDNNPQSRPGCVSYTMPSCAACDCSTCTAISTYKTTFSALCATGLRDQPYTITETYLGMSSLPVFATPTAVPYGFTVAVETCTYCGAQPLTVTITYPSGGSPFVPTTTEGNSGPPPVQTNLPPGVATAPAAVDASPGSATPTYPAQGNNRESPQPQSTTLDTIKTPAITNVPPDSARPTAVPWKNSTGIIPNTTIAANINFTFPTAPDRSYSMSTLFSSYGSAQEPPPATLTPAIYSDWASSVIIPATFLRVLGVLTATIVVGAAFGALIEI